ncbi:hypothetical protein CVO77_00170 [Sphingopyxis lindanitolerans]|uniref:Uncharacterized protein n=1 Tax=Sphingopyxis lindanitolerans TaxID=2054227 RepID=A0A2S8BAP1_9SPHN|nr:hypothetical protein [Sphingopyxis lindanitolerans]PQM29390.1 hypothetical protein CVO77_00170 [Sphingopyxis lindanitolerans]
MPIWLLTIGRAAFAPVASLWRYLAADWHRMAFALLIALCAFLTLRLHAVDGSRDDWRDKAQGYEAAAKALAEADKVADRVGLDTAAQTKGTIDAGNERARAAAAGSDDPLKSGLDSLRTEGRDQGDKAPR